MSTAPDTEPAYWYDWKIFMPLLTQKRGRAIVRFLKVTGLARRAELSDPRLSFDLTLDNATAERLRIVLSGDARSVLDPDGDPEMELVTVKRARAYLSTILEDLDDYLGEIENDRGRLE